MASVLVVEDDRDTRRLLQRWLARGGHAVDLASSGEQALERLAGGVYDLILLDLGLPGIDGAHFARQARERRLTAAAIVACTLTDRPDGPPGFAPDHWLCKPFGRERLDRMVASALQRR